MKKSFLLLWLALFGALLAEAQERVLIDSLRPGTLEHRGSVSPLFYQRSGGTILFQLPEVVARLGGQLRIGILGEAHTLVLDTTETSFGPASQFLIRGEEILDLSTPPLASSRGLMVPLDFLEQTYGTQFGYKFRWSERTQRLSVDFDFRGEIAITLDSVHIAGVSTLVFELSDMARFRTTQNERRLEISFPGRRLIAPRGTAIEDPLVRSLRIAEEKIILDLAPGAEAASPYAKRGRRQIVVDIARGRQISSFSQPDRFRRRPQSSGLLIVLDPGHGGKDHPGAQGPSGTLEKDLTLEIARRLKRRLATSMRAEVLLTRAGDIEVDYDERTGMANQNRADLFLSLHLNSQVGGRGARGAETYFLSLDASDAAAALAADFENNGRQMAELDLMLWDLAHAQHLRESQSLARTIQGELNQALELRDRGVRQAPFRVLMGATMPAVLVELGFLSNPEEETLLRDPSYQGKLVDALASAIGKYFQQTAASAPSNESLN